MIAPAPSRGCGMSFFAAPVATKFIVSIMAMAAIAMSPLAIAEPFKNVPASKPPSLFRQIYACEPGKPASASALGEIASSKIITVVGPSGKGQALVREILPNEGFGAGVFKGTRLELAPDLPCTAAKLAILAPPGRVEFIPLDEMRVPSAIARVADYLNARNKKEQPREDADERPAFFLTNYRVADARTFSLGSRYTIVLANVAYDVYVLEAEQPTGSVAVQVLRLKYRKEDSPSEPNPILFAVSDKVFELTADVRDAEKLCDRLVSAFAISRRIHIHTESMGCNNGIIGQMTFDLSGPAPKAVFSDWELSN